MAQLAHEAAASLRGPAAGGLTAGPGRPLPTLDGWRRVGEVVQLHCRRTPQGVARSRDKSVTDGCPCDTGSPVIPWKLIDTAAVPGDGGELRLLQRGAEFSIRLGHNELMNSRIHGSEEALAEIACARIGRRPRPRVLIGGLGMGFTLRAALDELSAEAQIVVAELVPAVIAWNRAELAPLSGQALDDPRVTVRLGDVGEAIRAERAAYDAILLDVDNGPEGLSRGANDRLYDGRGLAAAFAALRPGGVLAVWSAGEDAKFTRRLAKAGFAVEEVRVRARGARGGARHVIWLATSPGGRG